MTLADLKIGQTALITRVGGEGALRRRLLDMGLTPRTQVLVRKVAPMGDPLEIYLRSYELTLRRADCARIEVTTDLDWFQKGSPGSPEKQPRHRLHPGYDPKTLTHRHGYGLDHSHGDPKEA